MLSKAEWDALFATNISGAITAVKLRQFVDAMYVQSKYTLAASTVNSTGFVHMAVDDDLPGLRAMAPLDPLTVTIGAVCARLNALKAIYISHALGAGAPDLDGEHYAADTTTAAFLTAISDATDLPSAIVLVGDSSHGFGQAIFDHGSSGGNHFHVDAGYGGNSFAYTGTSPPVTVGDCAVAANDILTSMIDHFANGIP